MPRCASSPPALHSNVLDLHQAMQAQPCLSDSTLLTHRVALKRARSEGTACYIISAMIVARACCMREEPLHRLPASRRKFVGERGARFEEGLNGGDGLVTK